MELKNKIILLTGGSTGIGNTIARSFMGKGAKIIVFGQNRPEYPCDFYKVDVSKEHEIINALKKILRIDVLINNAGIARILSFKETSAAELDKIMDVNLKGTFWMCKHSIPKMGKGSCIINISSIAGIKSFANYSAYCASKAGVVALTKSFALEFADKGIRANSIAPGLIDTPIFGKMIKSEKERKNQVREWTDEIPLKRIGRPEEIAHAVTFLAENDFVDGIVLPVDGGESIT